MTIAESISRVRGIIKGTVEDSFLTDRMVYSIISKYAKALMRREEIMNKLMMAEDIFTMLPFVELIEVDKIEADCAPIKSKCIIMRTKNKLPSLFAGTRGPLIRRVYSIDGGYEIQKTTPATYISISLKTTTLYDKTKYYWFKNGYLYFPNVEGEAVMVEGIFEDVLDGYCLPAGEDDCKPFQEFTFPLPDYLFAEVEQMAEQEFMISAKMPGTQGDTSEHVLRP